MILGETPFQRHLLALSAEYERLALENTELKKEMQGTQLFHRLRHDHHDAPPLQPVTAYVATPSTSLSLDLPGAVRNEWIPNALKEEGCDKVPNGSPRRIGSKSGASKLKRQNTGSLNKVPIDEEESEDNSTFLLLLDVIPACVIVLSAAIAGMSADICPDHAVWKVLEILFTVFFIGEIVMKLRVFGFREYLRGADWYWSWFDIICVVLAIVDLSLTYSSMDPAASSGCKAPQESSSTEGSAAGTLGSLKMLKLARLGRIVRLLKFKIFQELKLMIQGVFTGLRVLFWAVVLLVGCMYLLGVISRTLFSEFEEFTDVPSAMFTAFRCFTDGCAAYDGTPLQEKLRKQKGPIFMFAYILLFLFVTIGIFNLIMAVFIDNVTDGSTKKRQRQLGQNAPRTEWVIASALREIILTNLVRKQVEDQVAEEERNGVPGGQRRVSKLLQERLQALQEMYGYKPHTTQEYEDFTWQIHEEMAERDIVVTKEQFNHWLSTEKELISRLEESEIDMSCKFDLFDVLDADLSGELEFEEMIDGLLKCRGPASKTDIIAIRLKTSLGVKLLTKICEKLGIQDD